MRPTLFTMKTNEPSPIAASIIQVWNQQSNLTPFKSKEHTKIYKQTEKYILKILQKGFISFMLAEAWRTQYDIQIEHLKPIPKDKFIQTIHKINELALTPKYGFDSTRKLDMCLYSEKQLTSTFLRIFSNELEMDIIDRIYDYFLKFHTKENEEAKIGGYHVYSDEHITEVCHESFAALEDMARRACRLAKSEWESNDWIDNYERDEMLQVIYDVLSKTDWYVPEISGHMPNINRFHLAKDYLLFIRRTSPYSGFKIPFLKVFGNGIWRDFVAYKKNNYGEKIYERL